MIPYGRQDISQDDIDAVVQVLQSDFLTQGPKVPEFETAVSALSDAKFGVAVNSATSALHIGCHALGVGQGDLVWTSPITFVATANSARLCGADVDFVDVDPDTFNICPEALQRKLVDASKIGRVPKVLIAVHMCGQSPSMQRISELASKYNVRVIEDASHSIGARYLDKPVGSCDFSDITIFSFHPVKIVTTSEGGMALTNDPDLAAAMMDYRSHGVTRNASRMRFEPHGPWYYEQLSLGLNYRMTDLAAALGISQLGRLDAFISRRHEIAYRYDKEFAGLPVDLPKRDGECYSAFHLYVIRLKSPSNHRQIFEALRSDGIGVNLHYIPVHLQPYYRDLGFGPGDFPKAENYYKRAISLPMFPGLTDEDQTRVIEVFRNAIHKAS